MLLYKSYTVIYFSYLKQRFSDNGVPIIRVAQQFNSRSEVSDCYIVKFFTRLFPKHQINLMSALNM